MSDPPQLYTVEEFVSELAKHGVKVHPNTVRNWARSGQIKAKKIGRPYYIFASEVKRLVSEQETEGNSVLLGIERVGQIALAYP